jgi:dienelactone hydrolase
LRKPAGNGPFPMVVFASGNGGEGLEWIKNASHNMGWTLDQFLNAGYAVAWMRYRAEVDVPEYDGKPWVGRGWSGRPRYNRAPHEYEDVIAIIEYVKTLPFVDAQRVGYMGMSHGGEMLMKIASEYDGLLAAIASEPASASFLGRRPPDPNAPPAPEAPETAEVNTPEMQAEAVRQTRARIDMAIASQRLAPIDIPIFVQGRDRDHNQAVFRANYELLNEAGKNVEWKSYDHDLHGFVYVRRNERGVYDPDPIQREAVADSIAFFDRYLKGT